MENTTKTTADLKVADNEIILYEIYHHDKLTGKKDTYWSRRPDNYRCYDEFTKTLGYNIFELPEGAKKVWYPEHEDEDDYRLFYGDEVCYPDGKDGYAVLHTSETNQLIPLKALLGNSCDTVETL